MIHPRETLNRPRVRVHQCVRCTRDLCSRSNKRVGSWYSRDVGEVHGPERTTGRQERRGRRERRKRRGRGRGHERRRRSPSGSTGTDGRGPVKGSFLLSVSFFQKDLCTESLVCREVTEGDIVGRQRREEGL